jgi:hypothetical protein
MTLHRQKTARFAISVATFYSYYIVKKIHLRLCRGLIFVTILVIPANNTCNYFTIILAHPA